MYTEKMFVPLEGFREVSGRWTLRGARYREDAYPFVYLEFDTREGQKLLRLDLGKRMMIDPLPSWLQLAHDEVTRIALEVGSKIPRA